MTVSCSVAIAATFLWLGMVAAISFIEAPLKFRAPNVTLQIGLGIGRLVFRALNTVEAALAVAIAVALVTGALPRGFAVAFVVAVAALAAQLIAVRPRLNRRSDAVLAQPDVAHTRRSNAHYAYVGCELVKVVALVVAGILLLSSCTC